jgi:hypothetical protein
VRIFLGFFLELLQTVVGWRFELFISFLFYNASRWMGDSSGVFRWSGPGHHCFGGRVHVYSNRQCYLILILIYLMADEVD